MGKKEVEYRLEKLLKQEIAGGIKSKQQVNDSTCSNGYWQRPFLYNTYQFHLFCLVNNVFLLNYSSNVRIIFGNMPLP